MTRVSITDFRDNLAMYLRIAKYKGETILIVDDKMDEPMAEVGPPMEKSKKEKDWAEYLKLVKDSFGVWKDLPPDKNRAALRRADRAAMRKRLEDK